MTAQGMHEAQRFRIKLSLGVLSYPLPTTGLPFDRAYYFGFAMLNKADGLMDEENEPVWDFEIKNDSINLSPIFMQVLDFEGEERIDLIFYGRV